MEHRLKIRVSKAPEGGGVVACRSIPVREKVLRLILGERRGIVLLVPGDSVSEVAISRKGEGDGEGEDQ